MIILFDYCEQFLVFVRKVAITFDPSFGIVAATFPSHYLWAWALCGGYQVAHLLTGRRVSHFPTHPRFPDFPGRISSNSRNGFTEYLQFISPLIGSPRPKPRPVSCLNWFDVKEVWMNQLIICTCYIQITVIVTFLYFKNWANISNETQFYHAFWTGI